MPIQCLIARLQCWHLAHGLLVTLLTGSAPGSFSAMNRRRWAAAPGEICAAPGWAFLTVKRLVGKLVSVSFGNRLKFNHGNFPFCMQQGYPTK